MITIQLSPQPNALERESIRQIVGFYRGIASFLNSGTMVILPHENFNKNGTLTTLRSAGYSVEER